MSVSFVPGRAFLRARFPLSALTVACGFCTVTSLHAEEPVHELPPTVITAIQQRSPLTVVADPKDPRQPVPASDAADYLKTIPGFSAIRSGGSNSDPVLRGLFGSRLLLLTDGGQMLGACPGRMDASSSYIAPETYDLLTVT
jgi:iron complex outermembrane receptor protein